MRAPKTVITHTDPDLDAICSVWLLKTFDRGLKDAKIVFLDKRVSGEANYRGSRPGESASRIFVDIGLSRFDHHQTDAYICSATLVRDYLAEKGFLPDDSVKTKALDKILKYVLRFDHGELRTLENEYRDFLPVALIEGKSIQSPKESLEIMNFGCELLDALYFFLVEKENFSKAWERRLEFKTLWGKGICLETEFYTFSRDFGLPEPYAVAVTLNPKTNYRRFWGFKEGVDFSDVYEKLRKLESNAWYLHPSKKILLSGAKSAPSSERSKLSLQELVEKVRV